MQWNKIEWTEKLNRNKPLDLEEGLHRSANGLPVIGNREYLVCLINGDHYISHYTGDNLKGWFYIEDLPAQYPVAWARFEEYKSE